jgi:hypothetical protein
MFALSFLLESVMLEAVIYGLKSPKLPFLYTRFSTPDLNPLIP